MRSALLLSVSLAATAVLANPIQKRAEVTDWVFETVYVTVTGDLPTPTSEAAPSTSTAPSSATTQEVQQEQHTQSASSSSSELSSPPSPASSKPISSDYAQGILDAHNNHRLNHSAPSLTWSNELAGIAKQIGESCVYAHDTKTGGGGYGQNIGAGAPPSDVTAMITNAMYNNEIGWYPGYGGEPSMDEFEKWGHFSQIVWKNTQEIGCATVYCPGGLANTGTGVSPYFTVCNYKPAGNFAGQYGDNVMRPNGMATIHM